MNKDFSILSGWEETLKIKLLTNLIVFRLIKFIFENNIFQNILQIILLNYKVWNYV